MACVLAVHAPGSVGKNLKLRGAFPTVVELLYHSYIFPQRNAQAEYTIQTAKILHT